MTTIARLAITASLALALLGGAPPAWAQDEPAPAEEGAPEAPPEAVVPEDLPPPEQPLDAPDLTEEAPEAPAMAAPDAPAVAEPAMAADDQPEPRGVGEAVDRLAERLSATMPQRENWIVAVVDFPDLRGNVNDFGRYLAQRATTRFSQRPGFRAVERMRLQQTLAELQINAAALSNPVVARRVGNQIGFNAIVLGTVSDLGQTVEIDARVTDLDESQVLPAVVVRVPKTPELIALVAEQAIAPGNGEAAAETAEANGESEAITRAGLDPRERIPGLLVLDETQPVPRIQNPNYRATVVAARKAGRTLQLVIAFENVTGTVATLLFRKGAYLLDGKGDRWSQTDTDTAHLFSFCCETGAELIPGTRRRTSLEFRGPPQPAPRPGPGPGIGEEYSLVAKEMAPRKDRTLVLPGIRLKPAEQ